MAIDASVDTAVFHSAFSAGGANAAVGSVQTVALVTRFGTEGVSPGTVVPEPASLALAGFAGVELAVGAIGRRRRQNPAAIENTAHDLGFRERATCGPPFLFVDRGLFVV
jgi:hypothetical protein